MGIDPLSAVAPARVKALIIPYAPIRQSRFLSFVARLEKENVVQLGDVSPDGRPHRSIKLCYTWPLLDILVTDASTSYVFSTRLSERLCAIRPFYLFILAITPGFGPFRAI